MKLLLFPVFNFSRPASLFSIALLAIIGTQASCGQSIQVVQLKPAYLADKEFVRGYNVPPIVITCYDIQRGLRHFRVVYTIPERRSAPRSFLSLSRDGKLIISSETASQKLPEDTKEVEKSAVARTLVYEFEVDQDFLSDTKFEIRDIYNGGPVVSGRAFWFNLSDFTPGK